jgi:hypothetical protein
MPTPKTINYLYIIVVTDRRGTSYEQKHEIEVKVNQYLVGNNLTDKYQYYDFVNNVRVSHHSLLPDLWSHDFVQIGVARRIPKDGEEDDDGDAEKHR